VLQELWTAVQERDPHEPEFLQAVEEVLNTATPVFTRHPEYLPIMKRLVEPERVVMFRVRPIVLSSGATGHALAPGAPNLV
jgi:glutamate dehydrogenase (NADP+)